MDPDTTLRAAQDAAQDGNAREVVAHLVNLCAWLAAGGSAPRAVTVRLEGLNESLDEATV